MRLTEISTPEQEQPKYIQFVAGEHLPLEAFDILQGFIDRRIQLLKLAALKAWEKDHNTDSTEIQDQINELQQQREEVKAMVKLAKDTGCRLSLNGRVEVKMTK